LKFSTSFSFKDKDIDRRNEKVAGKKKEYPKSGKKPGFPNRHSSRCCRRLLKLGEHPDKGCACYLSALLETTTRKTAADISAGRKPAALANNKHKLAIAREMAEPNKTDFEKGIR
jgi:hypothetical protein